MENYIIMSLLALVLFFIGLYLGRNLGKLKQNAVQEQLKQQVNSAQLQLSTTQQQLQKQESDFRNQLIELKDERNALRTEKDILHTQLTRVQTEYRNLQEKLNLQKTETQALQEKFEKEFENLANKILEQKSEKFTKLNQENISRILLPLQDKIKGFEIQVEKNKIAFIERHAELGQQLEQLSKHNQKISEEAINLTRALKGNTKMQGNWGEMILERVLEQSGLEKGREYFTQKSFTTENNKRLQPDVIIALPGDKRMIVDSKVSLIGYERYINASTEEAQKASAQQHLLSIKTHIEQLSRKNYQELYTMASPDFVLLFIPIESAFALATQLYPNLYNEAFTKNIIIVTPTTLLAVLKTIDSMWQNEKQKQNAIEIATQAGKLYDNFVNLISELDRLGKQLGTVQTTYDKTMRKLTGRGNLVTRVEQLKTLGAKAQKQIDSKYINSTDNTLNSENS